MFRSNAHFSMIVNLKYIELQKLLLNRFNLFKNHEIKILKKNNMKSILYEWAIFLTKENKNSDVTYIPTEVLTNKQVVKILQDDIDCKWLVNKINIKTNDHNKDNIIGNDELKKIDNLHFDEYPKLFYFEYPQYPYNYYDKKKMTSLYSLIKFPYNDILNISKNIKNHDINTKHEIKEIEENKKEITESSTEDKSNIVNTNTVSYSNNNYIYAPSELETSKEK